MPINRFVKSRSGQVMVLVAVLLIGLVAMLALVLDGGNAYLQRRNLQNAVDAAALASAYRAAQGVSDSSVRATLIEYAITRNGADSASAVYLPSGARVGAGSVPPGTTALRLTVTQTVSTFFAGAVGLGHITMTGSATAGFQTQSAGCGSYAVWAHSQTCLNSIDWSGSGGLINGKVHSNAKVSVSGSDHTINGNCEYVTSYAQSGSDQHITYVRVSASPNYPVNFNIVDYRPGGRAALAAQAAGKYFVHTGNWSVSGSGQTIPTGLHYVTGNASFSGSGNKGTFTVVAEGTADISGSGHTFAQYIDGLFVFSNYERSGAPKCTSAICNVSGSGSNYTGVIFAPKGKISFSGSGQLITRGSLIGWAVDVSGSGFTLDYLNDICTSQAGSIVVRLTR
jgi:Flp pilus assembly protein TadG